MEYSVLIVDDDVWMQRILSKTLQSYGFNKTYLASNGFDAVAMAVEAKPTLIVLDILMPELTGHLTLKILKRISTTKDIPVVMVSALSDAENLGLAVKSGTAGFISKPFTRATVYDKLVDVFGKENLDAISRGEAIRDDGPYYSEEVINYGENPKSNSELNLDDSSKSAQSSSEKSEQLRKHYHQDEKKSLESIKKMLLKSKK